MLTSDSTGNAKAVELSHAQILAAVAGKTSVRQLQKGRPMLNWIGMDHVASRVEIHVQASLAWRRPDPRGLFAYGFVARDVPSIC